MASVAQEAVVMSRFRFLLRGYLVVSFIMISWSWKHFFDYRLVKPDWMIGIFEIRIVGVNA